MASGSVTISCIDSNCNAPINVRLISQDQEVNCPRCRASFVFYGLVEIPCPNCLRSTQVALKDAISSLYCESCRTLAPVKAFPGKVTGRVARVLEDLEGSYYYCGLDTFQGVEEQVPIANKAFEKLDRRILSFFKVPKRMVFFNVTDKQVKGE